jgi:glycogen synthase
VYQPRGQFKNAKVAFCIHNIAFQGRFWPESFKDMALPPSSLDKLGFKDGYSKVGGAWTMMMRIVGLGPTHLIVALVHT